MKVWFFISLIAVLTLSGCGKSNVSETAIHGNTMGTSYHVKLAVVIDDKKSESLKKQIDDVLINVNALMSTYDPNSELSRLNQYKGTQGFVLSFQTALVVKEALRLGSLSDGILDITVGPLVNLWGFGPNKRTELIPTQAEIDQVLGRIGLDKIKLEQRTIIKALPDLYIDLSTIAKGYGVDVVANLLEDNGYTDYLVEIGGEMRVSGSKLDGSLWRIAIEKPMASERAVQRIISIGDNAIATSGDYRNYYENKGVRYSHLINPKTGYPINHNLVTVTVIHPSSMTADGLATALNVMGFEQAKQLVLEQNLAAFMVTKEGGEYKEYASPAFNNIVSMQ